MNDIERDDYEPGEAVILEHAHPDTEGSQKKQRVYENFTDEQEELLVNWLKDNPISLVQSSILGSWITDPH